MLPNINSYGTSNFHNNRESYGQNGNNTNTNSSANPHFVGAANNAGGEELSATTQQQPVFSGPNSDGAIELNMRFSFRTRRGYMPTNPNKQNQDACIISNNINKKSWQHFFSVCDGHGVNGHHVSGYLKQNFPTLIATSTEIENNPRKGLNDVFEAANY